MPCPLPVGRVRALPLAALLLLPLAGCLDNRTGDGEGADAATDADARAVAREASAFVEDADEAVSLYLAGEATERMTSERLRWDAWTFLHLDRLEGELAAPAADSEARTALDDAIGLGLFATRQGENCVRNGDFSECRDVRRALDDARAQLEESGLLPS